MIEVQTKNSWLIFSMCSEKEIYGKTIEPIILKIAENLGYSESKSFGIRLACEEAVMNAIKHGNKEDKSKQVKIGLRFKNNLEVFVRDEGKGFNRKEIPDCTADDRLEIPYGRGLCLIESYSSAKRNNKGNLTYMKFEK